MEGWMKRLLLLGCVLSLLITPVSAGGTEFAGQEERSKRERTETVQPGKETEAE
jgi:hypothetical protein